MPLKTACACTLIEDLSQGNHKMIPLFVCNPQPTFHAQLPQSVMGLASSIWNVPPDSSGNAYNAYSH
jgi:hypothetical protein